MLCCVYLHGHGEKIYPTVVMVLVWPDGTALLLRAATARIIHRRPELVRLPPLHMCSCTVSYQPATTPQPLDPSTPTPILPLLPLRYCMHKHQSSSSSSSSLSSSLSSSSSSSTAAAPTPPPTPTPTPAPAPAPAPAATAAAGCRSSSRGRL